MWHRIAQFWRLPPSNTNGHVDRCMNTLCRHVCSATRLFSTRSRPIQSTRIIKTLSSDTHDSIWPLLLALRSPNRVVELPKALAHHNVDVDEYLRWGHAVSEPDLTAAVTWLQSTGGLVHPSATGTPLPSWLALYLIAYKIRTHDQAAVTSLDLTYSHLVSAAVPVQASLLIFALLSLGRFNIILPMRRLVESFLTLPLPGEHAALYFNLLLQTLACVPTRSVALADTVIALLKAMHARQLPLTQGTYFHLLNDRFVTLQLTKNLQAQMIREGAVPSVEHLEAYLRVFAKGGVIHSADKYRQAIHVATQDSPPLSPTSEFSDDPVNRANTHYLSLFDDRRSAFAFLRSLSEPDSSEFLHRSPNVFLKSKPKSKPKDLDQFAYTSTLAVAARDHSVSDVALLSSFERLVSSQRLKPNIVNLTILIRGLLARKSKLTARAWNHLCRSGLTMDKYAVSLGAVVCTKEGKPELGLELLLEHAGHIRQSNQCKTEEETQGVETVGEHEHRRYRKKQKQSICLTSVSLNDYLVALNRISRPDAVFVMWDNMGLLFGVYPDARTLSILLRTAVLARRLDDSLKGALAQLRFKNPFRVHRVKDRPLSTSEAKEALTSVLGTSATGPVPYKPMIWHERRPSDTALRIFQEALVGSHPSLVKGDWCSEEELEEVEERVRMSVPVVAVRRSVDEDPMTVTGFGFREMAGGRGVKPEWPRLVELLAPPSSSVAPSPLTSAQERTREMMYGHNAWSSRHPHIAITNENCITAITLMGRTLRAPEIPLLLAWMKEIGVHPTRPTLAVALVFWEEVAVRAPLVERWGGRFREGDGGSDNMDEYERLKEWMTEWVGKENMPTPGVMGEWCKKVARMREVR